MHNILIVNEDKRTCQMLANSFVGKENNLICVSNETELNNYNSLEPNLLILTSTFEEFDKHVFGFLLSTKCKYPKVPSVLIVTKLMLPQYIPLFDLGIDTIISNYSSESEIINEVSKVLDTIY